jgi:hypothetical protein
MSRCRARSGWCQTGVPYIDAFNEILVVVAVVAFVAAPAEAAA